MKQREIKLNNTDSINLEKLIDTRLLVQANSGGGKSWLLRRLLEQSHGKVQQIVIDLEGEFSTLREKFDYILAGKNGDTPAEPKSAALLAKKILEMNVSAIIDLYELPHHERKRFVRLFLESLINAPKNLWHPCLVVLDEAHVFCPEKGQSEAMEAVIDLATRGRKRGYCAILATQRLSKLHKDAAAECNNKLIGRTGLDIDMKRASEELGFTTKEQYLSLRKLDEGEFFAFGSAISNEIKKVKIGNVQTSHPKAGSRILTKKLAPPTAKIKSILKKLSDLPEEAQKESKTINEFKTEIKRLKMHRCPKVNSKDDIDRAIVIALQKKDREFYKEKIEYQKQINNFSRILGQISKLTSSDTKLNIEIVKPNVFNIPDKTVTNYPKKLVPPKVEPQQVDMSVSEEKPLTGGALRMLKVLVSRHPMVLSKTQLATFSKLSPRSGTYGTYLSALRSNGFIEENNGGLIASQEGIDYLGETPEPPQTTEEIIEMWRNNLNGGARRMFDVLVENYPNSISKEELGMATDLSPSSGTFGTYLSMLRSNALIEVTGQEIKAAENLFI